MSKEQTPVEWLLLWMISNQYFIGNDLLKAVDQAKQMEKECVGHYTKEDVLKAGEIGEINHHDYEHIASLLDEAKALNKPFKQFSLYEHKETVASSDTITHKNEISDKEIEEGAADKWDGYKQSDYFSAFQDGAKWYREQLKQKR